MTSKLKNLDVTKSLERTFYADRFLGKDYGQEMNTK